MTLDELLSKEPGFYLEFCLDSKHTHHDIYHHPNLGDPGFSVNSKPSIGIGVRRQKFHFRTWEEVLNHIQTYDPNGTVKPEEMRPMKITLSQEELKNAMETYIAEHITKAPVTVNMITMEKRGNGYQDSFDLVVDVQPKETAK